MFGLERNGFSLSLKGDPKITRRPCESMQQEKDCLKSENRFILFLLLYFLKQIAIL